MQSKLRSIHKDEFSGTNVGSLISSNGCHNLKQLNGCKPNPTSCDAIRSTEIPSEMLLSLLYR